MKTYRVLREYPKVRRAGHFKLDSAALIIELIDEEGGSFLKELSLKDLEELERLGYKEIL